MQKAGLLILLIGVVCADSQIIFFPLLLICVGASLSILGALYEQSKK